MYRVGADRVKGDWCGHTPVHAAAIQGDVIVVHACLVEASAQRDPIDADWCTPLYRAGEQHHQQVYILGDARESNLDDKCSAKNGREAMPGVELMGIQRM